MSATAPFVPAAHASPFARSEPGRRDFWLLPAAEKLLDTLAVIAAVYAADNLYRAIEAARAVPYPASTILTGGIAFALLFVFLLERHGGYRPCVSLLGIRETERTLRVTLQAFSVALVAAYLSVISISRLAFALLVILVPLFVTLEKWEMRHLLRTLRSKGHGTRRALIMGTGIAARRIYTALVRSPKFGVEPVAFVESNSSDAPAEIYECSYERKHSARVIPGPLREDLFRQFDASVLIVADASLDRHSMLLKSAEASQVGVTTYFTAGDFLEPGYWLDYAEFDGIMLGHLSRGTTRTLYDFGKRSLDLIIAALALVLFAPVAAFLAILVKTTSPGPIFFRQERVGREGRLFPMYKFRSMFQESPRYGYSPTNGEDPRVTPVGRFLRRTSLDELPQILNVLLGQMSIVGPRPEMPFIVEQYTPLQRQRLAVKPGMTGLWQISADRAFLIHENMEYDLYYVRHRSLFMDVAILLHTLLRAAHGI